MRLMSEVRDDQRRVSAALFVVRAGMTHALQIANELPQSAQVHVARSSAAFLDVIESWPQASEMSEDARQVAARIRLECCTLGADLPDRWEPRPRASVWRALTSLAIFGAVCFAFGYWLRG